MRYSTTHKQETRDKLLDSSRAIAKKGGFDATGIDALMAAIGLTGGAFYSHFQSKDDLFAAIVEREMEHSAEMLGGAQEPGVEQIAKQIRTYLGSHHAQHPETGCALTTLGAEIARSPPPVRAVVERSLKKLQRAWSEQLGGDGDKAWALIAECIGAVVMARAVTSDRGRQEILSANRRFVEKALAES